MFLRAVGQLLLILITLAVPSVGYSIESRDSRNHHEVEFILDVLPENLQSFNLTKDGKAIVPELRKGNPALREIALTFDDGPHPLYTAQLLAILRYYRVPATFFMVGVQAERYTEWVKMVFQEGHEIGNHTYDHFRLVNLPYDEQVYQIEAFQELIHKITGVYPRFLRPPGGQFDRATVELMNKNGLALGLWTINSKDGTQIGSAEMLRNLLKQAESGSIILFHDGREETIRVLPSLIETLKRRGFRFVTMSQMLLHANSSTILSAQVTEESDQTAEEQQPKGSWKVYSY